MSQSGVKGDVSIHAAYESNVPDSDQKEFDAPRKSTIMNKAPLGESMDKIEIEDDENEDNNFQVQNESVYMNQGV